MSSRPPYVPRPMIDDLNEAAQRALKKRAAQPPKKFPPATVKGHVEMFVVSDEDYAEIYVDGAHAASVWKERLSPSALSSSSRKAFAAQAGVAEEDLRFTLPLPPRP